MSEHQKPDGGPAHTPLPWTVYSGKLRPQFPTRIIEIQGEAGERIVAWPGFDGLDMSNHHAALVEALRNLMEAVRESRQHSRVVSGNRRLIDRCGSCRAGVRAAMKIVERTVDCPECHELCGWCSWYRKNAREVGCGLRVPSGSGGRAKHRCEWGEAAKGVPCSTCDGSGRAHAYEGEADEGPPREGEAGCWRLRGLRGRQP